MPHPIKIGSVELRDFEVPSSIRFGGSQRLSVMHLSGGSRVVQTLGAEPGEISFSGTFTGPDASSRLRTVDNMRQNGRPVWLSWDTFRYVVVVRELEADYHSHWWIHFQLTCTLATDLVDAAASSVTLLASIASSVAFAQTANRWIDLSFLQTQMTLPRVLVQGTRDRSSAIASASTVLCAIDAAVAESSDVVEKPIPASANAPAIATTIAAQTNAAEAIANLIASRGYVGHASSLLRG